VYVAWLTFKNAVEQLTEHLPNRVDRSVFPSMAGGVQNQLFAALKFLGLTGDDGRPTQILRELAVSDEATRKQRLAMILRERYAALFKLDLTKTTYNELTEQMGVSYGVSGSSRKKAVRFFLTAADHVGVPLSPHLKSRGSDAGGTPTPRNRRNRATPKDDTKPRATPTPTGSNSREVRLKSGGTLTLTASVDFLTLDQADRDFVFKLIDDLKQYETK